MSRDVALEIRPSRPQHAGWLGAFVLLMLGFGAFSEHTDWPLHLGLTALMILLALPAFFDTAPRLVIADEGLSWRKDRKDPLSFLPWSEILAADFKGGGEDDPRCLRLKLDRPSALERVASDRKDGWPSPSRSNASNSPSGTSWAPSIGARRTSSSARSLDRDAFAPLGCGQFPRESPPWPRPSP